MKKTITAVLLVLCTMLLLLAGCGSKTTEPAVSVSETFERATPAPAEETPEPTAEPEQTAEPEESAQPEETAQPEGDTVDAPEATAQAEQSGGNNNDNSNNNNNNNNNNNSSSPTPTPAPTATPEPDPTPAPVNKKDAATDLIGSGVDSLYAAIGSPNSSSYTESCLVIGGEDGFLYYDGFTVETVRRSDGSELIVDVF